MSIILIIFGIPFSTVGKGKIALNLFTFFFPNILMHRLGILMRMWLYKFAWRCCTTYLDMFSLWKIWTSGIVMNTAKLVTKSLQRKKVWLFVGMIKSKKKWMKIIEAMRNVEYPFYNQMRQNLSQFYVRWSPSNSFKRYKFSNFTKANICSENSIIIRYKCMWREAPKSWSEYATCIDKQSPRASRNKQPSIKSKKLIK